MMQVKLGNVFVDDTEQFYAAPKLYCQASGPLSPRGEGFTLMGPGHYDFTTFFNALSVGKWKTYTIASNFFLHIETCGQSATIYPTRADAFSWEPIVLEDKSINVSTANDWQSFDIELDIRNDDVVVGFLVVAQGTLKIRNAYYYTKVDDESKVQQIELSLCTTTFKKEEYIERNISLVEERILSLDEPIASHFTMHVVDNGRTLDATKLQSERIIIHKNPNVGGAGGFARGMIESLEQTPTATHVLLMDDDVIMCPESFIRTYSLYSLINDEYRDAILSGAMMVMNEPSFRWEDLGYMDATVGACVSLKPRAQMDTFRFIVQNETFTIPYGVTGAEDQVSQHYAAWWYCGIPVSIIKRQGLPLPIFVRYDDVEYGLREPKKFMTMNGICIWHMSFEARYNAAQERYQTTRNMFINRAVSGFAPMCDFEAKMHNDMQVELKKYNYDNAELILDGFEDFLKGPSWIMHPNAERAFMDANKHSEELLPLPTIREQAREYGVDLGSLSTWDIERDSIRKRKDAIFDYATFNGQRIPMLPTKKTAVIDAQGATYQKGKLHGSDVVIAIDSANYKGVIRKRDRKRFTRIWDRYKRDLKEYKERKDELINAYAAAKDEMTSVKFWKRYLGLDE